MSENLSHLNEYVKANHETLAYRPVVVSILFNSAGEVLITKTPIEGAATPWSFPQGGVDFNENLATTMERELLEELGISSKEFEVVQHGIARSEVDAEAGRVDKRGFTRGKAYIFSVAKYTGDGILNPDPSEVAEARWMTIPEAISHLNLARPEKSTMLVNALNQANILCSQS